MRLPSLLHLTPKPTVVLKIKTLTFAISVRSWPAIFPSLLEQAKSAISPPSLQLLPVVYPSNYTLLWTKMYIFVMVCYRNQEVWFRSDSSKNSSLQRKGIPLPLYIWSRVSNSIPPTWKESAISSPLVFQIIVSFITSD